MNEKPILYSTPMIQAILAGRKTMTRRTNVLNELNENPHDWIFYQFEYDMNGRICAVFCNKENNAVKYKIPSPYGKPGDLLWVRETFLPHGEIPYCMHDVFFYDQKENPEEWKWKPSIYMPKSAARIWLWISNVRIERLQDITEQDAIAEGVASYETPIAKIYNCYLCEKGHTASENNLCNEYGGQETAKASFQSLWSAINSEQSWNENPWVWVVSFEVLSTTGKPII